MTKWPNILWWQLKTFLSDVEALLKNYGEFERQYPFGICEEAICASLWLHLFSFLFFISPAHFTRFQSIGFFFPVVCLDRLPFLLLVRFLHSTSSADKRGGGKVFELENEKSVAAALLAWYMPGSGEISFKFL